MEHEMTNTMEKVVTYLGDNTVRATASMKVVVKENYLLDTRLGYIDTPRMNITRGRFHGKLP